MNNQELLAEEEVAPPPAAGAVDLAAPRPPISESTSSDEDNATPIPPRTAPSSSSSDEGHDVVPAEDGEEGSSSESDRDYAEVLNRLQEILSLPDEPVPETTAPFIKTNLLDTCDLAGVAALISSGRARRIICMCGAGISVSAGIPDFRTPGTGLYSRLAEYKLPHPTAVFEIDFFKNNPHPFYLLARELYPGNFAPTPTHHFIRLLHDKGLLLRCYTQNIDSLEQQAGVPRDAIIAAHGNFDSAHCIECKADHHVDVVKEAIFAKTPCYCVDGSQKGCKGLVKPGIVFFGENLPDRFWKSIPQDFPQADLLIVLGTSLVVHPFAGLIDKVEDTTPRLLINRERVGERDPVLRSFGLKKGFEFGDGRDAVFEGDCDHGIRELCQLLGWEDELEKLIAGWGKGGEEEEEDAGPASAGIIA